MAAKDDSAAPSRKGGKSVIPAERDEYLANLPRTTSGGSKSAIGKDDSAAPPKGVGVVVVLVSPLFLLSGTRMWLPYQ
jgi:hypothetical protein